MSGLRKKALVIDDSPDVLGLFLDYGNDRFDVAGEVTLTDYGKGRNGRSIEVTLELIDKKLRSQEYIAILLDGDLRFGLGGKSDGDIIARRIRNGDYGEINRNTPLYSISSCIDMFSQELGIIDSNKPRDRSGVERIARNCSLI